MDAFLLFVKWIKVRYEVGDIDNIIKLEGVYFSGPVLKQAARINEKDSIKLDFTEQYSGKIPEFYIATLSWTSVRYTGSIIYLNECTLDCAYKQLLPTIKDDDYFVVNTILHTEENHKNYLNYTAELYSAFGEPYAFR